MAHTRKTQRTLQMIKDYMGLYNEGYSNYEIADMYDIHYTTVLHYLQEIAEANGLTRDDLLQHKSNGGFSRTNPFYKDKVDVEGLKKEFEEVEKHLDLLISELDKFLFQLEEGESQQ